MKNEESNIIKSKSLHFSLQLIRFTSKITYQRELEIILKQVIRCGTSIAANIVEAQGSPTKKDFINFLHISLKSAKETQYWLWLLKESNLLQETQEITKLDNDLLEITKILNSILITLKRKSSL